MGFDFNEQFESGVKIKVIGVGGGGGNAINRMVNSGIRGVEFVAMNTDGMALKASVASTKLLIGENITKRFGAGANPEIGRKSAEESIDAIRSVIEGADMIFITAGMGGGTGTGAAPVVARIARELGILTIGIVTKPFSFEGKRRMIQALAGITELEEYVDSLIVIPNERLMQFSNEKITLANAFEKADDVLRHGVESVSKLINEPGFINLDFADVKSVMQNAGLAHMGVGVARGEDKARIAAEAAIASPLLETSISGATGILINITVAPDVALEDATYASKCITEDIDDNANIIWGASFDPELEDEVHVTIIATGFKSKESSDSVTVSAKPQETASTPIDVISETKEDDMPVIPNTQATDPDDDDDDDDFMKILRSRRNI